MESANPRRKVCDLQIWGNPLQVGVGGKHAIEVICPLFVVFAIRQHQQFRHRYRGCDRFRLRTFKPGKNWVGVSEIFWVGFQLINEDTRVQSDSPVTPEKGVEPLYSQLWRSFCR